MESITKAAPKSKRDIAYYNARYQNRVYAKLFDFVVAEMKARGLTNKYIADRLGKDPGQISRLLSKPSNLTLDTVSELLLALDAEPQPPEIVRFSDIRPRQYAHPLIARATGVETQENRMAPKVVVSSSGGHILKYDQKSRGAPAAATSGNLRIGVR